MRDLRRAKLIENKKKYFIDYKNPSANIYLNIQTRKYYIVEFKTKSTLPIENSTSL